MGCFELEKCRLWQILAVWRLGRTNNKIFLCSFQNAMRTFQGLLEDRDPKGDGGLVVMVDIGGGLD